MRLSTRSLGRFTLLDCIDVNRDSMSFLNVSALEAVEGGAVGAGVGGCFMGALVGLLAGWVWLEGVLFIEELSMFWVLSTELFDAPDGLVLAV